MALKSGPCWSCAHCVDNGRTIKVDGVNYSRASCEHPITKDVWADWRSKALIDSQRDDLTPPEGGPLVLKIGSPLTFKWPVTFLPDNIQKCPLYQMRVDMVAIQAYRNQINSHNE